MNKRGFSVIELLVVIGIFAILAALLLPVLSRAREAGRRASCVNNLRQMAIALKAYSAEDSHGKYPPFAAYYDREVECNAVDFPEVERASRAIFFWNPSGMAPAYIADPAVIVCPSDQGWNKSDLFNESSDRVDIFEKCAGPRGWTAMNGSYAYMGHVYDKLDDLPAFTMQLDDFRDATDLACESAPIGGRIGAQLGVGLIMLLEAPDPQQGTLADSDYDVSIFEDVTGLPIGNGDSHTIFRLREGVERFLVTDSLNPGATAKAQSRVEVMWDQVSTLPSPLGFNHLPGGANVLFLDGHVEYLPYPSRGPASGPSATFSGCLEG